MGFSVETLGGEKKENTYYAWTIRESAWSQFFPEWAISSVLNTSMFYVSRVSSLISESRQAVFSFGAVYYMHKLVPTL